MSACVPRAGLAPGSAVASDARDAACPILADAALERGTILPPIPERRPIVAYPSSWVDRPQQGDSVRVHLVVDRDGTVPPCAVTIESISDPALTPHVASAAASLRFQPAQSREGAAPTRLVMTLLFAAPEQAAAAAEGPRRVKVIVQQTPVLLPGAPQPVYPAELVSQRLAGRVLVRAIVTTEGRIDQRSIQVVSSDHRLFTTAVRAILPQLRFDPARMGPGGAAVAAQVQLPFEFLSP